MRWWGQATDRRYMGLGRPYAFPEPGPISAQNDPDYAFGALV